MTFKPDRCVDGDDTLNLSFDQHVRIVLKEIFAMKMTGIKVEIALLC